MALAKLHRHFHNDRCVCMYVCVRACVRACVRVCVHTCVHVSVHISVLSTTLIFLLTQSCIVMLQTSTVVSRILVHCLLCINFYVHVFIGTCVCSFVCNIMYL